jgi:hypothetical protein
MKKTNLVLAILMMTACTVELPTSLIDQTDLLAASLEVDHLICTADSLAVAINETGTCSPFNVENTRIDYDGFFPVVWTSSNPPAVSVTTGGQIQAESVPDSAFIEATGTNNTKAGIWVTSF